MRKMTVRPNGGNRMHVRNYHSLDELMASVKPEKLSIYAKSARAEFMGHSGIKDAASAIEAYKSLWEDGMKYYHRVHQQVASIPMPTPHDIRRKPEWMSEGDEFDLDRHRSGQEECWRGSRRRHVAQSVNITLVIGYGGTADKDAEDLIWTPIAAIALADILETAGYSVRVVAANKGGERYGNNDNNLVSFVIKDAGESINPSSIVNALSGWFYRTIMFAEYYNGEDQAGRPPAASLGYTTTVSGTSPEYIDADYRGGHVFVVPIVYSLSATLPLIRKVVGDIDAAIVR